MKGLTQGELLEWMAQHLPSGMLFDPGSSLPKLASSGYSAAGYQFPKDSGRKVYLARVLFDFLKLERSTLVYVRNVDVFPSSGYPPLLSRFRQALGEKRELRESPGHLFSSEEGIDATSLLVLSLEFFWDCFVLGESGKVALQISHDECFDLIASDKSLIDAFRKKIDHDFPP
jgi:hypothetical protein